MRRLTNAEVAQAVGIARSTVSRLRSGTRRPSTRVAERILRTYVPADDSALYRNGVEAFAVSGETQVQFLVAVWGEEPDPVTV